MSDTHPPLDYLTTSSKATLESFELSRLARSANLRKELRQILEEWVDAEVDARMARCILDCRRAQDCDPPASARQISIPADLQQFGMPFLPAQNESEKPLPEAAASQRRRPRAEKPVPGNESAARSETPMPEPRPMATSKCAAAALRVLEQQAQHHPDAGACAEEDPAGASRSEVQSCTDSPFDVAIQEGPRASASHAVAHVRGGTLLFADAHRRQVRNALPARARFRDCSKRGLAPAS
ncbi:MAG: hypothetical protein ACRD4C_14915 [Candidatus Acidiferrales bacterium]